MNIRLYIASGIVESYALGLASPEESSHFEAVLPYYPELKDVLRNFEYELELFSISNEVRVPNERSVLKEIALRTESLTMPHLEDLAKDPDRINDLSPRQFEELAAELLRRQGYTVTLTPATRDGGKDLVLAHETGLGQFVYFVECKKYGPTRKIGVDVLREFYGVIAHDNVTAGILVTNTYFTQDAHQWQQSISYRLKLVDRTLLLKWLAGCKKGASSKRFFGFFG